MGLEILVPLAPFIMVLGIIWLVNNRKLEEKRISATAEASSEKAAQYASRVGELEERVKVLERIVTDRGYDIATQIEALRDQREVEEKGSGVPLEIKQGEKA
ncbi:hypothetical protein [Qipengyuania flava]|uniref:hypothetical protein n=1 Tax=Qipengyuania flava TaxID=192812 RepID=UPI001C62DD5B|nr:hypothetical protein [Qipengyuania flava]QYJ06756.1 hypothetical protein KUV82_11925 [Qipengyuania flava]